MTIPAPIYNPNTPQNASDSFAVSQPQLLDNFQVLFDRFSKNHIPISTLTTAGNHTIIELLQNINPPQTDVSEISVYTQDVAGQTDQVFLRYQGNGQQIQFTNYQIYSLGVGTTKYFTFLPGKVLVYFGSYTTLENNKFMFQPAIVKNIISMSITPNVNGFNKAFKPWVEILPAVGGLIPGFTVIPLTADLVPSYYFIMVNV